LFVVDRDEFGVEGERVCGSRLTLTVCGTRLTVRFCGSRLTVNEYAG